VQLPICWFRGLRWQFQIKWIRIKKKAEEEAKKKAEAAKKKAKGARISKSDLIKLQ